MNYGFKRIKDQIKPRDEVVTTQLKGRSILKEIIHNLLC